MHVGSKALNKTGNGKGQVLSSSTLTALAVLLELSKDLTLRRRLDSLAIIDGLPKHSLDRILPRLAKANLLDSRRGAHGGYLLARPPAEISLLQVVEAVQHPFSLCQELSVVKVNKNLQEKEVGLKAQILRIKEQQALLKANASLHGTSASSKAAQFQFTLQNAQKELKRIKKGLEQTLPAPLPFQNQLSKVEAKMRALLENLSLEDLQTKTPKEGLL